MLLELICDGQGCVSRQIKGKLDIGLPTFHHDLNPELYDVVAHNRPCLLGLRRRLRRILIIDVH